MDGCLKRLVLCQLRVVVWGGPLGEILLATPTQILGREGFDFGALLLCVVRANSRPWIARTIKPQEEHDEGLLLVHVETSFLLYGTQLSGWGLLSTRSKRNPFLFLASRPLMWMYVLWHGKARIFTGAAGIEGHRFAGNFELLSSLVSSSRFQRVLPATSASGATCTPCSCPRYPTNSKTLVCPGGDSGVPREREDVRQATLALCSATVYPAS